MIYKAIFAQRRKKKLQKDDGEGRGEELSVTIYFTRLVLGDVTRLSFRGESKRIMQIFRIARKERKNFA